MKCTENCSGRELLDLFGHSLLSHRTVLLLARTGILTEADLRWFIILQPSGWHLLDIRNLGGKSYALIRDSLKLTDAATSPMVPRLACPDCGRDMYADVDKYRKGGCAPKDAVVCSRYWKNITSADIRPWNDEETVL